MKIGDIYDSGIVFEFDSASGKGKVVSSHNLSNSADWEKAVNLCKQYRGGNKYGWYLPSVSELELLLRRRDYYPRIKNYKWKNIISQMLGFDLDPWGFTLSAFWSSSEFGTIDAFGYSGNRNFSDRPYSKTSTLSVRAVRKFQIELKY